MSILFKNAQIIDPTADDVTTRDLMVRDGKIVDPSGKAETVIECSGKYLAPGIVDIGVKVCEPGERHKESYKTAGAAAAAGGVTTIVTRPDTDPAIDTPEALEFIRRRAAEVAPVNVLHIAALTKGRAGREMTEIGFLQDAGAVAFSDGYRVVQNTKVLARAMVYAKSLGALIIAHPQEPILSDGGVATSGKFASLRGLPHVSPMAERMGLDRDISMIEMTGAAYHADQIT
ncbi:MAG: dihydroorotase, partial [Paracoccaceae bacterium]